jgi:hypothetical protein
MVQGSNGAPMTPADLIAWRFRMGWTAKAAAEQLGLSVNGYAAYERGFVTGSKSEVGPNGWPTFPLKPRPIPKHVALACERLEEVGRR